MVPVLCILILVPVILILVLAILILVPVILILVPVILILIPVNLILVLVILILVPNPGIGDHNQGSMVQILLSLEFGINHEEKK